MLSKTGGMYICLLLPQTFQTFNLPHQIIVCAHFMNGQMKEITMHFHIIVFHLANVFLFKLDSIAFTFIVFIMALYFERRML